MSVFVFISLSASGDMKSAVGWILSVLSKNLKFCVTLFSSPDITALRVMCVSPGSVFVISAVRPVIFTYALSAVTVTFSAFSGYVTYADTVSLMSAVVFDNVIDNPADGSVFFPSSMVPFFVTFML